MFFLASKLFWLFCAPSHLIFLGVLASAILLATGYLRAGHGIAVASAVLFAVIGLFPSYTFLLRPLEERYSRPEWPAHVDGIVVLGSGQRSDILRLRGAEGSAQQDSRMLAAFAVARRYPAARIIFSGGDGTLGGMDNSEAQVARFIFGEMGLDPKRLVLESHARNTGENLLFSRVLAHPAPGETWLLATSASHMPRAMGVAARLGWNMMPWPTDYFTTPRGLHGFGAIAENLGLADYAMHEWIGLLAYRLRG